MVSKNDYTKILLENYQLGPYPMEKLKRVNRPTTLVTDEIERIIQRGEGPVRNELSNSNPTNDVRSPFTGSTRSISIALMASLNMIGQGQGIGIPEWTGLRNVWFYRKYCGQLYKDDGLSLAAQLRERLPGYCTATLDAVWHR